MSELMPPRVLHIITSLDTGGAEMMLVKLLEDRHASAKAGVIVLMGNGALLPRLRQAGIPVACLGLRQGGIPGPRTILGLYRYAREFSPTVLQGWMYHGNLAAWLLHRILRRDRRRLYWNVRQTLYDLDREKPMTRWIIRFSRALSNAPDRIVYNSVVSAAQHEVLGFPAAKRIVIPNGFDPARFRPNPAARQRIRCELGVDDDTLLVGQVARYHPMKDHATLLKAVQHVATHVPTAKLLLVGRGLTTDNLALIQLIDTLALKQQVILAGERSDIPDILAALDLLVSASAWGEGFPNVIGEAMACEIPCVVTDVGDSAAVLGDCGRVVPSSDPDAMARAITVQLRQTAAERSALGHAARKRILAEFAMAQIRDRYQALYCGGREI